MGMRLGITWGEGLGQRLGLGRGWGRLAGMNGGTGVEGRKFGESWAEDGKT